MSGRFLRLLALVARRDYMRTVRRRGFLLGTALLPLSIGLFMGLSAFFSTSSFEPGLPDGVGRGSGPATISVVNESGLALAIPAGSEDLEIREVDRHRATEQVRSRAIREAYVLAANYLETGHVQRLSVPDKGLDIGDLTRREAQEETLARLLRESLLERAGVPSLETTRVLRPLELVEIGIDGAAAPADLGPAAFFVPYAFSLLFVISIFITSGYLLQSVTEEKENRVVEILLSSVPALPLMAGKIIGLGAAGLTQVLIWLITAALAIPLLGSQAPLLSSLQLEPATIVLAVLYFILGYGAYGAIFSAIGALAPGAREAQQYSGFFGFFAVIPMIATGVFLTDPSSPIVTGLVLFPLTAPAASLQLLVLAPETPWALIALSLAVLTGFLIAATIASARVFRATLLLYGTRPGLRQIGEAILARD